MKYKRNYVKEIWWNRPWKYLPDVLEMMNEHPYNHRKGDKFFIWLRNMFYLNWQVCLEKEGIK